MKKQLEVINEILEKDKSTYTMQEVMDALCVSFCSYEEHSDTAKTVMKKLTEAEYNSFINGLTVSFMLTLHTYRLSLSEAMELAKDLEGLIGVGISVPKDEKAEA